MGVAELLLALSKFKPVIRKHTFFGESLLVLSGVQDSEEKGRKEYVLK